MLVSGGRETARKTWVVAEAASLAIDRQGAGHGELHRPGDRIRLITIVAGLTAMLVIGLDMMAQRTAKANTPIGQHAVRASASDSEP
jgi:hypothetical protein